MFQMKDGKSQGSILSFFPRTSSSQTTTSTTTTAAQSTTVTSVTSTDVTTQVSQLPGHGFSGGGHGVAAGHGRGEHDAVGHHGRGDHGHAGYGTRQHGAAVHDRVGARAAGYSRDEPGAAGHSREEPGAAGHSRDGYGVADENQVGPNQAAVDDGGGGVGRVPNEIETVEVDGITDAVDIPVVENRNSNNNWVSSREIMSLAEICKNVDKWYDPNFSSVDSGSRSTKLGRKQPLPLSFQKDFPDAIVIKVSDILKFDERHFETGNMFEDYYEVNDRGEKVIRTGSDRAIGVLCGHCRKNLGMKGPNPTISSLFMKNRGQLINVPRAPPFGNLRETFRFHEFGSKVKGELWKKGPIEVRKLFLEKKIEFSDIGSSATFHLRTKIEEVSSKIVDDKNQRPDQLLMKKVVIDQPTSYDAIQMLLALCLKLIKQRVSLFTNLKEEIKFLHSFGAPAPVKYLSDTVKMHYTSKRAISDIIDTLDLTRHYGVLMEVMANRAPGTDPKFGAMLDCGSAVAHFREYVGYDIKVEDSNGYMVNRVLGFPATDKKTGFKLIQIFQDLVDSFNQKSALLERIFIKAGVSCNLPPADVETEDGSMRRPILSLKGVDGLGVDGALISKNIQINKRILLHNPHCTSIWCACHSGQLSVTRLHTEASRNSHPLSDRQMTMMHLDGQSVDTWIDRGIEYTKKLHDVMTASCQVDKIFKDAQNNTQEALQFKNKKSVQIGGRSMHRWESDLHACRRSIKILESIINTLEDMVRRGLCNDPHRPLMYSTRNVLKISKDAEFWANLGWRENTLSALVKYIINMEYSEADPEAMTYNRDVCLRELAVLVVDPADPGNRSFKQLMARFKVGGSFEDWTNSGENFNEARISRLYYQATNKLIDKFKQALPDETAELIEMFSWMSLTLIRRKCKVVSDLDGFKSGEIKQTVDFFCEPKTFVPQFSLTDPLKTSGAPSVTANPMVDSEDELISGIDQLRRYLFLVRNVYLCFCT